MEKGIQLTAIIVTALATVSLAFFGWQQMKETNRLREIQKTSEWGQLRNVMWEIMEQYPSSGIHNLKSLSDSEKITWLQKIRKLLDSQIGNLVLIEDKNSLGCWRNAISTAKVTKELLQIGDKETKEDRFIRRAESIHNDVMSVWTKIILESDEVSATGGRPQEVKQ